MTTVVRVSVSGLSKKEWTLWGKIVKEALTEGIIMSAIEGSISLKRACPIGISRPVKGQIDPTRTAGFLQDSIEPRVVSRDPPISEIWMWKYGLLLDAGVAGPHRRSTKHKGWIQKWLETEGMELFKNICARSIEQAFLKRGFRKPKGTQVYPRKR